MAKTKLFSLGPWEKENYFPLAHGFFFSPSKPISRGVRGGVSPPRGDLMIVFYLSRTGTITAINRPLTNQLEAEGRHSRGDPGGL